MASLPHEADLPHNQAYNFSTKYGSLAPSLFMDLFGLANMSLSHSHVLGEASLEDEGQ